MNRYVFHAIVLEFAALCLGCPPAPGPGSDAEVVSRWSVRSEIVEITGGPAGFVTYYTFILYDNGDFVHRFANANEVSGRYERTTDGAFVADASVGFANYYYEFTTEGDVLSGTLVATTPISETVSKLEGHLLAKSLSAQVVSIVRLVWSVVADAEIVTGRPVERAST